MENIVTGNKARKKIVKGINTIADTIKKTMGPRGKNVIIDTGSSTPIITNDGATIAKEIYHLKPFEDMGLNVLKEVALKTNDEVGDGTTTATVLAQSILKNGLKKTNKRVSIISVKNELNDLGEDIFDFLKKISRKVNSYNDIYQIAKISSGSDNISNLIKKIYKEVDLSSVFIEKTKQHETEYELVEGIVLEEGYISSYLIDNISKSTVELKKTYIILYDGVIENLSPFLHILKKIQLEGSSVFLIAKDYSKDAVSSICYNKMQNIVDIAAIKIPNYGVMTKEVFSDLALMFSTKLNQNIEDLKDITDLNELGVAKHITVYKDKTIIALENIIDKEEKKEKQQEEKEDNKQKQQEEVREEKIQNKNKSKNKKEIKKESKQKNKEKNKKENKKENKNNNLNNELKENEKNKEIKLKIDLETNIETEKYEEVDKLDLDFKLDENEIKEFERKRKINELINNLEKKKNESIDDYTKLRYSKRINNLKGKTAIIYLGGNSELEIQEKKFRLEDALNSCISSLKDGILPGSGIAYILVREYLIDKLNELKTLKKNTKSLNKEEYLSKKIALEILINSLLAPFNQIILNSNKNPKTILKELNFLNKVEEKEKVNETSLNKEQKIEKLKRSKIIGFDANSFEYVEMYEKGIINPTLVEITALKNAISISSLILTTESAITSFSNNDIDI